MSKLGDSLSLLAVSLDVSAEGWSATGEFPTAGQQEIAGAEVRPKKGPDPRLCSTSLYPGGRILFPGCSAGKAGAFVRGDAHA